LVGFVDDNPRLQGRKIKGYPVFGSREDLGEIVREYEIKTIIISFRRAGAEKASDIKSLCDELEMKVDVKQMQVLIS
jgi:FlaA1/EpsC-like NDP-sugar epimerase